MKFIQLISTAPLIFWDSARRFLRFFLFLLRAEQLEPTSFFSVGFYLASIEALLTRPFSYLLQQKPIK